MDVGTFGDKPHSTISSGYKLSFFAWVLCMLTTKVTRSWLYPFSPSCLSPEDLVLHTVDNWGQAAFSLVAEDKTVCSSGYAGVLGFLLLLGDS